MVPEHVEVLRAGRVSELCRQACAYAGIPTRGLGPCTDRFIIRSGQEPPELLALVLEEALIEDAAEITPDAGTDPPDIRSLPPGQILVREGFDSPCPIGQDLEQMASPGKPLSFAIERYDEAGKPLDITWVVLAEELPLQEVPLTAAVARQPFTGNGGSR